MLPEENIHLLEYRRKLLINLKEIWTEFQKTGKVIEPGIIKPEVITSWKRCHARGLDAFASPNVISLSSRKLKERLKDYRLLIEVANPFFNTLVQCLKGSGFRIDLLDKDLFILAQWGDKEVIGEAAEQGSYPGVNRSEINCGTSAINLAANLQRPVQLIGAEHYNINLHYWTCSAVPIYSPHRDFLGVINMAGNFSLFHKHTLGMVVAVGKVIEQILQQRELMVTLELSNEYLNNVIQAMSDGLIVTDRQGKITTLNQAISNFLGISSALASGQKVDEILGPNNPFNEVLKIGQPIINKEIILKSRGRRHFFIGTLKPVNIGQNFEGVIGILKPLVSAKGIVKNVAGLKAHFTFTDLIGENPGFKKAVQLARKAAELPTTVLLEGESGTGKELFAQAIHNASPYHDGPFVALNCAAVPGELIESELFGYESGAFTGAKREGQPGKFELAEGGTIFLDEINSMPLNMQAKLLRILQTKTVMRVGGVSEIAINARLICASNRDLWKEVQKGSFREDLFYRINVLQIAIPPLRERVDDIPLLTSYFLKNLSNRLETQLQIDERALDLMQKYHWPGNIRELENVIERSAILALGRNSRKVEEQDILSYSGLRIFFQQNIKEKDTEKTGVVPETNFDLRKMELAAIRRALALSDGNLSQAARILGIARTTLYRKMKKYHLES